MLGALSDRFGRRPVLVAIDAGRVLIFAGVFLIRDSSAAIITVAAPARWRHILVAILMEISRPAQTWNESGSGTT